MHNGGDSAALSIEALAERYAALMAAGAAIDDRLRALDAVASRELQQSPSPSPGPSPASALARVLGLGFDATEAARSTVALRCANAPLSVAATTSSGAAVPANKSTELAACSTSSSSSSSLSSNESRSTSPPPAEAGAHLGAVAAHAAFLASHVGLIAAQLPRSPASSPLPLPPLSSPPLVANVVEAQSRPAIEAPVASPPEVRRSTSTDSAPLQSAASPPSLPPSSSSSAAVVVVDWEAAARAALARGEWREACDKAGRRYFFDARPGAGRRVCWNLARELERCATRSGAATAAVVL